MLSDMDYRNEEMNMPRRKIMFSPPDISEEEIEEVGRVLRSGWITTGPKVKELEELLADFLHVKKSVCLSSATAAEELIFRVLQIGSGDEVIVPAYTYSASASAAIHVGAKVVFVDSQPDSAEMDYDALERAITPATKAIVAVDLGGVLCDYKKIYSIVERKREMFHPLGHQTDMLNRLGSRIQQKLGRIVIIADCAHALGSYQIVDGKKKMAGAIADFSFFSFHAVKNVTTGEGGAVTWNPTLFVDVSEEDKKYGEVTDQEIYHMFQLLSLHGQSKDALAKSQLGSWEYDIVGAWYKCNMTDIMAAIGIKQLERYKEMLRKRQYIVEQYDRCCDELEIGHMVHEKKEMQSSMHLYITRISGIDEQQRGEIMVEMAQRGISCNVHYKPLPMMTAYHALGYKIEDYPNSYRLYQNEITLPLHTLLDKEDIDYVVENYKDVIARSKKTFFGFERMERSS